MRVLFLANSSENLPTEVGGVLLREVRPLLRQIVLGKNGRNGAGRHARAAIDALNWIDEQLIGLAVTAFVFFGVDAIDGTGVHAGGVLGADTGFCNHVCHFEYSPKSWD